ncbi:ABC-2 transporter permease [Paenibacillus albiflavus]|uniref:ABC-2 transporter permease n=1 Tax=Paenibacillus albiflavus TaxID=2545760 RepID=A0A4R4E790_9BACL|nr:ABC-2 transporter permease [Paenibacillus albiflavus]TCZ75409.1 ABC-2 transporter permease [Paenibacillus albiflavus]
MMRGFILKDLYNMTSNFKQLLVVILSLLVMMGTFENMSAFSGMFIILLLGTLVVSSFSFDDMAKWDRYAIALPVTRKQIVLSKYVVALIGLLTGTIVYFIANIISLVIHGNLELGEMFLGSGIIVCVVVVMLSVMLPLVFKFGAEKSRIIMMLVMVIPWLVTMIVMNMGIPVPSEAILSVIGYSLPVAVIILLIGSYLISVKIYEKKDLN